MSGRYVPSCLASCAEERKLAIRCFVVDVVLFSAVVALTITFLSAIVGYEPPLNAVMMLWVNLIMDTMGALALGTEPPTMALLRRRPYKRNSSLINRIMWRHILVQAAYQLVLLT